MSIRSFFNEISQELKVLLGEGSKDKEYSSQNSFPGREGAAKAFEKSKEKLFDINRWSELPGITSKFELHNLQGNPTGEKKPGTGYFIRIILPAPAPENWVEITHIRDEETVAEFTVNPCKDPQELAEEDVEHFFIKEASSTFRVKLKDRTIYGYEIGKNEGVNNQDKKESGKREVINTLLAAGGWAGFQTLQWEKLTKYLVHLAEIK
jgi:hypothetical protein